MPGDRRLDHRENSRTRRGSRGAGSAVLPAELRHSQRSSFRLRPWRRARRRARADPQASSMRKIMLPREAVDVVLAIPVRQGRRASGGCSSLLPLAITPGRALGVEQAGCQTFNLGWTGRATSGAGRSSAAGVRSPPGLGGGPAGSAPWPAGLCRDGGHSKCP